METEQFKVVKGEVKGRHKHLDVRLEMFGSYPCEVALLENGNRYVAVVNDGRVAGSVPKRYTKAFLAILDSGRRAQCLILSCMKAKDPQYEPGNGLIQECLYILQRGHEVKLDNEEDTDDEDLQSDKGNATSLAKSFKKIKLI